MTCVYDVSWPLGFSFYMEPSLWKWPNRLNYRDKEGRFKSISRRRRVTTRFVKAVKYFNMGKKKTYLWRWRPLLLSAEKVA